MEERRREPRFRALKSGTIALADGSVDCRILNLSTAGACLEVNRMATMLSRLVGRLPLPSLSSSNAFISNEPDARELPSSPHS
jgi:hypothetical protein